ncbi:MAG: hypothetical protein LBH19_06170, partial [Dysgonamonadaceae bacterium]|nr:hypothetical protein [Dysgonamonadaceae bacterium]
SAAGIYAAGTITVAASNACGTSATKSNESNIRVFSNNTRPEETVTGNNGSYRVYCYPDDVGCWMIDNSKEGSAMASQYVNENESHGEGERGYYYDQSQADLACPNGFSLPSLFGDFNYQVQKEYLTCPDTPRGEVEAWLNEGGLAGIVNGSTGTGNYWGKLYMWAGAWAVTWNSDEPGYYLSSRPIGYGLSVRCVKSN